jgi:murein DD-endopeptidase MepM/ murein hydrolase activator NlpD
MTLSGDPESTEPGKLTGSIPKLMMPGYKQENEKGVEVDPNLALTKSEGQLAQGWVVENQSNLQGSVYADQGELEIDKSLPATGDDPYWDVRVEGQENQLQVGDENYELEGKFGEVAPLYDRFGLVSQALSFPTDEPLEIPDVNCPAETYSPRPIIPKDGASWFRKAIWRALEVIEPISEIRECDLTDIGCIADMFIPSIETLTATGDLDVQSKVSLAGGAWANMAGPSGAFAALLPPETIFKSDDSEEPRVAFSQTGGLNGGALWSAFQRAGTSILKIASLGNVGEAVDCLVYGLTAHPANARPQVCDNVLISGKFIGWPTYHGFIFQGPKASCADCTHGKVEAIDIGPGFDVNIGDAVLATTTGTIARTGTDDIYGNYIDLQSTDPEFSTVIRYGHLSAIYVGAGEPVSPGKVIGAVGDTGMGGIHLHYEFRFSALEMKVPYIPEDGGGGIRGCLFPKCPEIRW